MEKEKEGSSETLQPRIKFEPFPEKKDCQGLKAGSLCPKCKETLLDYDGMLNLACAKCGVIESGGFT